KTTWTMAIAPYCWHPAPEASPQKECSTETLNSTKHATTTLQRNGSMKRSARGAAGYGIRIRRRTGCGWFERSIPFRAGMMSQTTESVRPHADTGGGTFRRVQPTTMAHEQHAANRSGTCIRQ